MYKRVKKYCKIKDRGFTLIELLLYIGILSVLILVISLFFITLMQSRIKNETIVEVEQQGIQVMQLITQDIKNAEDVTSPAEGASDSSLSLNVLDVTEDPTVFDLSGGTIRVTEGGGTPIELTNSHVTASGLTFENLASSGSPDSIKITFTLTRNNPSGRNEYSYEKTFYGTADIRF